MKTWECRIEKHIKNPLWRHWINFFLNLRMVSSQIFVKVMWSNFHQHRPRFVEMRGCDRHTDRQTDTHTHTLTHRQGSPGVNIFSPEMTEHKNTHPNHWYHNRNPRDNQRWTHIKIITEHFLRYIPVYVTQYLLNAFNNAKFIHILRPCNQQRLNKPRPITLCIISSKCMKCISAV